MIASVASYLTILVQFDYVTEIKRKKIWNNINILIWLHCEKCT